MNLNRRLERLEAINAPPTIETNEDRWQRVWQEHLDKMWSCPHPGPTLAIYGNALVGATNYYGKSYGVTVQCTICGHRTPLWKGFSQDAGEALYTEAYHGADSDEFKDLAARLIAEGDVEQVLWPDDKAEQKALELMIRECFPVRAVEQDEFTH